VGFWRGGNLSIPSQGAKTGNSTFYAARQQTWEHKNLLKAHYKKLNSIKSTISIGKKTRLKRSLPGIDHIRMQNKVQSLDRFDLFPIDKVVHPVKPLKKLPPVDFTKYSIKISETLIKKHLEEEVAIQEQKSWVKKRDVMAENARKRAAQKGTEFAMKTKETKLKKVQNDTTVTQFKETEQSSNLKKPFPSKIPKLDTSKPRKPKSNPSPKSRVQSPTEELLFGVKISGVQSDASSTASSPLGISICTVDNINQSLPHIEPVDHGFDAGDSDEEAGFSSAGSSPFSISICTVDNINQSLSHIEPVDHGFDAGDSDEEAGFSSAESSPFSISICTVDNINQSLSHIEPVDHGIVAGDLGEIELNQGHIATSPLSDARQGHQVDGIDYDGSSSEEDI